MDEFIAAKEAAVDIICLLLGRFPEFMTNYVQGFFDKIWSMIGNLPPTKTFNSFVSAINTYLQLCLKDATTRDTIMKGLEYLFSKFLVHHMAFTEDDLDEFDGNEEAFIKMDLEENDKETRRRSCFDLVKKLTNRFEDSVKSLITDLQAAYCDEYYKDPVNNWSKQILVINFVIASTVELYSFKRGATKINIDQNLLNTYFEKIIVPELETAKADAYPILTSQAIKFLIIYRNFIPTDWLVDIITKLTSFLTHESIVIRTYSA
jgi:hypothetical protein